jgi:hypothetical protein
MLGAKGFAALHAKVANTFSSNPEASGRSTYTFDVPRQ